MEVTQARSIFLDGNVGTIASSGPMSTGESKGASLGGGNMFSGQKFDCTSVRPWKAVSTMAERSRAVIIACRGALSVNTPAPKFM